VLLETSGGYGHCNLLQWLYKAEPPVDEYRVFQHLVYFSVLLSVTKIRIMPYRAKTLAYSAGAVSQQLFRRCECAVCLNSEFSYLHS
jgi:hypothetical protein